MVWLRLEDNMLDHPKWRRAIRLAGDDALGVWIRLVSWCSRNLTDGAIPCDMVEEVAETRGDRGRRRALEALISSSLVARDEHGSCTIVDYLERNPSRSDVRAERDRRAQAERLRRGKPRVTGHESAGVPDRAHVPIPSRPVPSQSQPKEEEETLPSDVSKPRHPGPLKQTARDFAAADPTGGAPVPKFNWDPDWVPTLEHQARGFEHGLTDEDIADELEDCRRKIFTRGFKSEDDQFFRELKWAGEEKSLKKAKEARSGANWEKPGHQRQSRG